MSFELIKDILLATVPLLASRIRLIRFQHRRLFSGDRHGIKQGAQ